MKLATTTRNKTGWKGDKSLATRNTLPSEDWFIDLMAIFICLQLVDLK